MSHIKRSHPRRKYSSSSFHTNKVFVDRHTYGRSVDPLTQEYVLSYTIWLRCGCFIKILGLRLRLRFPVAFEHLDVGKLRTASQEAIGLMRGHNFPERFSGFFMSEGKVQTRGEIQAHR